MAHLKRVFDILIVLILLILLFPLIIMLNILVFNVYGAPVIFKQERPGYKGKIFYMYKFRTMTDDKDATGNLLPDEKRLTRFGKLMRSTSLDELPELLNVLKGDMSLVGPRPLLVEYLKRYTPEQMRRHNMKPGITGWAQINGRNTISWEEKFKLDVWYVDNWSILLDLKILFKTLIKVFVREGINQEGNATVEPFRGSNNDGGPL